MSRFLTIYVNRRRYTNEIVVEKILRYDLPARFGGENSIDLEML
jgi:hypothetical protein